MLSVRVLRPITAFSRPLLVAACAFLSTLSINSAAHAAGETPGPEPHIPIGGGSGILIAQSPDKALECTVTTIGHDEAGHLIGFTAGHCGAPGAPVVSLDPAHHLLGHIARVNPDLDYALIDFDDHTVIPERTVNGFTISSLETVPHSNPRLACKLGATTGKTCGLTVVSQANLQTSQMCVLSGDSGAPVMVGNMLIAMVNAYYVFGCFGPESGTTISAIVNDINTHYTPI